MSDLQQVPPILGEDIVLMYCCATEGSFRQVLKNDEDNIVLVWDDCIWLGEEPDPAETVLLGLSVIFFEGCAKAKKPTRCWVWPETDSPKRP